MGGNSKITHSLTDIFQLQFVIVSVDTISSYIGGGSRNSRHHVVGQGVSLDRPRKFGEEQQGAQGGDSGKLWPVQPLQLP